MKIESKILIVAVIILVVVFVSIQYFGAIAENQLEKEKWTQCLAGCNSCNFYVGDDVRGKTKKAAEEYLKNEMQLYQITEKEVFGEVEKCSSIREERGIVDERPFYPYTELLREK